MAIDLTDEQRAGLDELLSKADARKKGFIKSRIDQATALQKEAEEGIRILKEEAPEGDERDKRILFLEGENAKWQQTLIELAKPDMSSVDIQEEKEEALVPHKFKSFFHFAYDLATEGANSLNASDELKDWRSTVKATMTAGNAEVIGTLIPHEYATELLDRQKRVNPILSRAMIMPMETNKIDIPYLESFDESQGVYYGAVIWYWRGESAQYTGSNIESGAVELVLRNCTGLARVTGDLVQYSPRSIEALLRRAFDYGMAKTINKVALRGTGAGQPLGVLNSGEARLEIAKETGQAADTFIYDNVLEMLARLYSADDSFGEGVWYANKTVLPQIGKLSVAVGTGGSGIFLTNNQVQNAPNFTLLGIPVEFSSQMSAVGDAGDVGLFDWSQYLVGIPAGQGDAATFDTSIHLYFDYNDLAFRLTFRMDGQPWWPDKYKPEYGTSQAPFITLAERA